MIKTNEELIIRQGDILFTKVPKLEKNLLPVNHLTVAHGEDGHTYRYSGQVSLFKYEASKIDEPDYVQVGEGGALLTHDEHKQIMFPEGVYKVSREQEYNYFTKELQKVVD